MKVLCSNPTCPTSLLMHTNCFAKFEDITCMKLTKHARCRGWSDRQVQIISWKCVLKNVLQVRTSVWNQRGYDLAFTFCSCDCGHGHLKKNEVEETKESKEEKKRKKEKTSQLPKLNVGDKGKVSDVKDFSEKFGRDKRIGDGAIPSKQPTEAVAIPISPWLESKETNCQEKMAPLMEGLAAPTLASFFPTQATSPKHTVSLHPTWRQYEMRPSQVYRKEQWSPTDYSVASMDSSSLYSGQKESVADGEPQEDWEVFESEDENSSLDEFSSAHGECLVQETGQDSFWGLAGIGESLQKDLVVGAMTSKAALQNLAQAKSQGNEVPVSSTGANVEVIQLRQQLLAETIARKDALKTISHLKGAMDMEEGEKAKEAAEWARRNNGLVEKLHTMEVKHAAEITLLKQELRQSQSFGVVKMGTISQLEEQLRAAREAHELSSRAEEQLKKMQRAELELFDKERLRKAEEEKEVKLLLEVFNKEMLKVGKSFAESRRIIMKKVSALEERLREVSKGVENVKFKGSTNSEDKRGDHEKIGNVRVGQMITSVEEEFMKAQELGTSIASRQKLLEKDFEAGRRRQQELTKETEGAMEIINRLKHVLKTLEDRQG